MNKLWIFIGGCVTGALGLLAAAGLADEGTGVATNTGAANTGKEDDERSPEEQAEEEAVKVLE